VRGRLTGSLVCPERRGVVNHSGHG